MSFSTKEMQTSNENLNPDKKFNLSGSGLFPDNIYSKKKRNQYVPKKKKDVEPNNEDLLQDNLVNFTKGPELKAAIRKQDSASSADPTLVGCSIVPHQKRISQFKELADYPKYQIPYPEQTFRYNSNTG